MEINREIYPFLVTVFPTDKTKPGLTKLFFTLEAALEKATGNEPKMPRPDATAAVIFIEGCMSEIAATLRSICDTKTKWLIVRIELPFAESGLSAIDGWVHSHIRRQIQRSHK